MLPPYSVEAARRQGFGARFDAHSKDEQTVRELLAGVMLLHPHPEWQMPEEMDWLADPFSDRNWRAQLHMLRWLDPLRRRADKGDVDAGALWVRLAESWVQHSRSVESVAAEAWMDMVDGIRALELCVAVPFVADHFPDALEWLLPSIQEHLDWLADERNHGHSNHALHQHQGLLVCAAVLRNDEMQDIATQRLEALFTTQYDDEGVNAEGAIAYHAANYAWWAIARRRLQAESRQVPGQLQLIDEVPVELAHATKPDGKFVSIGDTDGGSTRGIDHPSAKWVATAGADGSPPQDLVRVYDAGYLFARSGWGEHERDFADESFFSVSFGRANRVHGHADGGAITFSSMGKEWITDPGKFQYGVSEMRSYCLSRESHSLPYIEGRPYRRDSRVECTRREINASVYDFTFEDRGYEGVALSRRVIYSVSGEYLVVIDTIIADDECTAVQHWQCAQGTTATAADQGFALASGAGRAAVLFSGTRPSMSAAVGESDPLRGWVSTGWKTRDAAPSLRFTKRGSRFRFVTVIAAGFRGAVPTVETVRDVPKGHLLLRVNTGRISEQVLIAAASARVLDATADASSINPNESSPASDAPAMDPRDGHTRERVLGSVVRARALAVREPARRTEAAAELEALRDEFDLDGGVDLGLEATISDLRDESRDVATARRGRSGLVNWTNDPARRTEGSSMPLLTLSVGDDLTHEFSEDTLVSYLAGPLTLPTVVSPADGDTLTVLFHGAVDRARTKLPLFQRLRFQKELAAGPTMAISDPTLDLSHELRLGWYLGTSDFDLVPAVARVVQSTAARLGATRVVLQGGSGGGFAALQVGAHVPGAHVVAMSPQTDLRRYSARFYAAAAEAAFGVRDIGEDEQLLPRVDVMRRIDASALTMEVTLVMNSGDVVHAREHATPLREFFVRRHLNELTEESFDLGAGHRGLDNEQYASVMRGVYARMRGGSMS